MHKLAIAYHSSSGKCNLVTRVSYFVLCVKNETEDESHVIFRCNAYERFRKEVNIIASTSTTQDTFNALSRVMAADDEESVIPLSRFLHSLLHAESSCIKSMNEIRFVFDRNKGNGGKG